MKYVVSLLLFLGLSGSILQPTALFPQQTDKRLARLDQEREKLKRQKDPVDRTKTDIRISEILLSLISEAVQKGDFDSMQSRLDEYQEVVQDAHNTMMNTGRDAHKKPGGFKDLEIALRRQLRQLEDIGGALSFDQRDPVTKARDQVSDLRDSLLKALLGGQNAPAVN